VGQLAHKDEEPREEERVRRGADGRMGKRDVNKRIYGWRHRWRRMTRMSAK